MSKLVNRARRRGIGEAWASVIGPLKASWRSSETLHLYVQTTADQASPEPPAGLQFEEAAPGHASAYARDIATDSAATFKVRLRGDERCFLVLEGETILHASWVTSARTWTREIGGFIAPPPGDAYLYESFTRAEARGRGIYPFALRSILVTLRREGVGQVWVGVESGNAPSVRAIEKGGFDRAFSVPFRRRLSRVHVGQPVGERAACARELLVLGREKTG